MNMSPEACVARGVKLLDQWMPGWEDKIQVDSLAMDTCERCVCGFVFADKVGVVIPAEQIGKYDEDYGSDLTYTDGFSYAARNFGGRSSNHGTWSERNGFDAAMYTGCTSLVVAYAMLKFAWIRVIDDRMAKRDAPSKQRERETVSV